MKRFWPKILSAFSTLTVGLVAASLARLLPAPAVTVRPPCGAAEVKVRPTPVPVHEIKQPSPPSEENTLTSEESMRPHPVPISPHELKRLIDEDGLAPCSESVYTGYFDYGPVLKRLDLKINDPTGVFTGSCASSAEATIHTLELDGEPGRETLLQLDFGLPDSTLYLIFKNERGTAGWQLLGSLPYVYGAPFIAPTHRVMAAGSRRWLVIDHSTGHGSGFGSGADDWYEVSGRGVSKVLSYQNGLYNGLSSPAISRETRVSKIESRDGIVTIALAVSTSYEGFMELVGERFSLWKDKRQVTFIKGPGMKEFVLETRRSEMPGVGLDPYYGDDDSSNVDFLKYNYRELMRLAAKGNAKQREWLRIFLDSCDDSVEKQSLLTALGGEQP